MARPPGPSGSDRLTLVELDVLEGLATLVEAEVVHRLGRRAHIVERHPTRLVIEVRGRPSDVLILRTAVAAYLLERYAVPRPKALLGDENLRKLLAQVDAASSGSSFDGFRFSAAGDSSPVFQRLAERIAAHTGLRLDPEAGELVLKVRPYDGGVWEVAVRLSPRPMSTRPWRLRNFRGALNATIAAAMVQLTGPESSDRFVNLLCGSGTLLVERALRGPAARLVGLDLDSDVLAMSRENASAAGVDVELVRADARAAPFPSGSFDVACTDLPYGHAVGSHAENEELAAAVLREAARLVVSGGRLLVISHELQRFRRAVTTVAEWTVVTEQRVFQKGHRPAIWQLARR